MNMLLTPNTYQYLSLLLLSSNAVHSDKFGDDTLVDHRSLL